jgi:hypothetical protein
MLGASLLACLMLQACDSTPTKEGETVARAPKGDCPVGTMICKRGSTSDAQTVDAEELKRQGVTNVGGTVIQKPRAGQGG